MGENPSGNIGASKCPPVRAGFFSTEAVRPKEAEVVAWPKNRSMQNPRIPKA